MKTLKKLLLSAGVIIAFIAYSFQQRRGSVPVANLSTPATNSTGTNPNTTTTPSATSTPAHGSSSSGYKDGTYTGTTEDAFYGNVEVQVTISGGKMSDVTFLQHPNDSPNSRSINDQATPILKQEAIGAQSAHVDVVTGATQTSLAFIQSLASALTKAN